MRTAITIALGIVIVTGLVIALMALIGWRLPRQHSVTRSILLHQSPETVYAVARDFGSMPGWRSDVKAVTVTTGPNGRVHFREDGKHGSINYELAEDISAQRMVTSITDTDLGYSGKWTYVFAAEGAHTRVSITEDGDVSNVIFRFFSRYAFGHTATIDTYLRSLGNHFGETVTPQ